MFMATWFECKISYDKTQDNGSVKRVSEVYIIDALSFTEAEARIIEEQRPFISGDFSVSAVKRTKIAEISWNEGGDKWYMVKVGFITVDEKSGVEKRTASLMLVQASDFKDAVANFDEYMKGSLGDYDIISIAETPVMDVYKMKVVD
ncbi:MAG: DUF4494 domain-containing protein [Muribaculaceae bacterium]